MVKIKVSYEDPRELDAVLKRLKPLVISTKTSKNNEGRFKKAYVNIRGPTKD